MAEFVDNLKRKPRIAHLLRSGQRFNSRLGNQFGAAITYFSVLAMVPILMFAFAALGFVLTVLRPDLLAQFTQLITDQLQGVPTGVKDQLTQRIQDWLSNWQGVGIVGLLSAMYAGAGWVANLKSAVRAQWRPDFDMTENKRMIVIEKLLNFAILIALLLLVLLTFGIATSAATMGSTVIGWLGLQNQPVIGWLVTKLAPIVASIVAGWLLFMFIYKVFPEQKTPFKPLAKGALIGAIGLGVLQYLSSFLVSKFSSNAAAAMFGPVIIIMLFFNLFARLILFVAAWIATATQPAVSTERQIIDEPLIADPDVDVHPLPDDDLEDDPVHPDSAQQAWGRRRGVYIGPERVEYTEPSKNAWVRQDVATRSVRAGMGAGWVTGAATGVGIGAVVTSLLARIVRRKR